MGNQQPDTSDIIAEPLVSPTRLAERLKQSRATLPTCWCKDNIETLCAGRHNTAIALRPGKRKLYAIHRLNWRDVSKRNMVNRTIG